MRGAVVTGANSFIGSATVKELVNNGYNVYAIVHSNCDKIDNLENVTIIKCDMSQYQKLTGLIDKDVDYFFHFAWDGASGEKRSDLELQLINVKYSAEALEIAKKIGCTRFIGAGSIVERECMSAVLSSGNKPGSNYIYGYAKLMSHMVCSSVATKLGMDIVWPLITNCYGVGEIGPRLVNTTIRKCMKGISPEFTSATQNYDFVYIDDVARAFRLIAEKGKSYTEYVIGSSEAKPLRNFLLEMKVTLFPDIEFIFGNVQFSGVNLPLSEYDCSMTNADTGFTSQIDFSEGCKRTYDWLRCVNDSKI